MTNVAVVVGGSIGGLLAELVLAEVCDRVVLVERVQLPDSPLLEVMQFSALPRRLFAPEIMLRLTPK